MSPKQHYIMRWIVLAVLSSCVAAHPNQIRRFIPSQEVAQWAPDDYENYDDEFLRELQGAPNKNPNFLANWPYLKSLLPPQVADEEVPIKYVNSDEEEVLHELPTPLALKKNPPPSRNIIRDHNQKKNVHSRNAYAYMSTCHFKICNMGRKRNVRFVNF